MFTKDNPRKNWRQKKIFVLEEVVIQNSFNEESEVVVIVIDSRKIDTIGRVGLMIIEERKEEVEELEVEVVDILSNIKVRLLAIVTMMIGVQETNTLEMKWNRRTTDIDVTNTIILGTIERM